MNEHKIGNFVLLEADGKRIAIGAPQIKMIRLVTEHPENTPDKIILEDGDSIPVLFIDNPTKLTQQQQEKPKTQAPTVDTEQINKIIAKIESVLPTKTLPNFPTDLPRTETLMDEKAIQESINSLKNALNELNKSINDSINKANENWKLLMTQLDVVKRNYNQMLEERKSIVETLGSIKK